METQNSQHELLTALHSAFRQEGHILTRHPELCYQQIHNRLNWTQQPENESAAFSKILTHPNPQPWIKSIFPPRGASNVTTILEGHTNSVNGCAIDRAGKLALSACSDGTIQIWDLTTGAVTFTQDLRTTLYCCDWSPRSDYFAAGGRYGTVYLFQKGHSLPVELSSHEDYILCCAFSPGGDLLLTGSGDHTVKLWNVKTGQEIRTFTGHESGIIQVRFGQDQRTFASTANDKSVIIWDLHSGQQLQHINEEFLPIQVIAISKDNQYLLTCGSNRELTLRSYPDMQVIKQVKADQKVINACAFSPDGRFLAHSGDNDLVIRSVSNLDVIATLSGHSKQIKDLAFSPDGKTAITASQDHTLRLWQLDLGEGTALSTNASFLQSKFNIPTNKMITSDDQGRFTFWNPNTGKNDKEFPPQETGILSFDFDLTGKILAACDRVKAIQLWNMETDQKVLTIETGGGSPIRAKVLTAQGKLLCLSRDWHVQSFDITSRRSVGAFQADQFRTSQDESKLALSFSGMVSNHSITLVDVTRQEILAELKGHESKISDFRFTHNSDRLVSASDDKTIKVWDCQTFREILTFDEHQNEVVTLAISPDDSMVLSLDDHGDVILWRISDGKMIHRFHSKLHLAGECFFSPDNTLILFGGDSHWVHVHRVSDGERIAAIPTFGGIEKMELHPFLPQMTGVDANGNLYLYHLMNITYGPIILTPYIFRGALSFICPACQQSHMLRQSQLGQVIQCPTKTCQLPIKLNTFTNQVAFKEQDKPKRGIFRRR